MPQEMTYAQALSEARQIIVQQSTRIKSDLEKIVSLQETIASQSAKINQSERTIEEQGKKMAEHAEQLQSLHARLEDATLAHEQADAIIDRQGQRLTQSQITVTELEKQIAEQSEQISQLNSDLEGLQHQIPTQEDADALAALSSLLMTKKVSVPASGGASSRRIGPSESGQSMRIAPKAVAA